MDVIVVFFGALAGAGIGAYGGLTVDRLRDRRELDLQRRQDIKAGSSERWPGPGWYPSKKGVL